MANSNSNVQEHIIVALFIDNKNYYKMLSTNKIIVVNLDEILKWRGAEHFEIFFAFPANPAHIQFWINIALRLILVKKIPVHITTGNKFKPAYFYQVDRLGLSCNC